MVADRKRTTPSSPPEADQWSTSNYWRCWYGRVGACCSHELPDFYL